MTFDADTVASWVDLPMAELRVHAQRLATARLPSKHPLWTVIRTNPALAAKLRSAFSGLLITIKGSRDEHMQRIWITAARNALDHTESTPVQQRVVEKTVKETSAAPEIPIARTKPAATIPEQKTAAPTKVSAIPQVLFQAPGQG